jgi:mRNA-degrading endonuclease RelE of RelBE toxin-antitoxin system
MFEIEFSPEAIEDMLVFRKHERKRIIEGIEDQIKHRPTQETHNRKRLRPNQLAEWELRIDKFRVFYDIDMESNRVKIEAVGWKQGNRLFLHREEYEL